MLRIHTNKKALNSYKSSCKKTDKIIFINRYAEKSDQQENIQL